MRADERAAAILQLLEEIEHERDETSDNRRRALLDNEAMQLRAMHSRLTAESDGSQDGGVTPNLGATNA
jgi:hypothetical protein